MLTLHVYLSFSTMSSCVIYASHSDCLPIYKDNKPTEFIVQLDRNLVANQNSSIELLEFSYKTSIKSRETLCIFTDICQSSFLNGKKLSVLRTTRLSPRTIDSIEFSQPIKLKLNPGPFNKFRIYIRDKDLNEPSVSLQEANLTLRLQDVSEQ